MAFQNTSEDFSEKESGLAMLVRGGGIVIAVLLFMGWLYVAFQVGAASASDYNQNGEQNADKSAANPYVSTLRAKEPPLGAQPYLSREYYKLNKSSKQIKPDTGYAEPKLLKEGECRTESGRCEARESKCKFYAHKATLNDYFYSCCGGQNGCYNPKTTSCYKAYKGAYEGAYQNCMKGNVTASIVDIEDKKIQKIREQCKRNSFEQSSGARQSCCGQNAGCVSPLTKTCYRDYEAKRNKIEQDCINSKVRPLYANTQN